MDLSTKPSVILIIGVNGVGKTTSVGKIAHELKSQGKKVVVVAADTFRAAAAEQLSIWCDRAGVPMISQGAGADPAAVVFDAASAVKSRGADVLIIDTAGRLHNKKNLMNELAKIDRVISKELPGAARETLLVLDATTGQNAVVRYCKGRYSPFYQQRAWYPGKVYRSGRENRRYEAVCASRICTGAF